MKRKKILFCNKTIRIQFCHSQGSKVVLPKAYFQGGDPLGDSLRRNLDQRVPPTERVKPTLVSTSYAYVAPASIIVVYEAQVARFIPPAVS